MSGRSDSVRTQMRVSVAGTGRVGVATGLPVLDHQLELLARHARVDLSLEVAAGAGAEELAGVGRVLGKELRAALRAPGARGHGSGSVPADEALAHVSLEASGRPRVVSNVDLSREHVGGLGTDLVASFLGELAEGAGLTLHVRLLEGEDTQHVLDAIFKSLGAALGQALERKEQ